MVVGQDRRGAQLTALVFAAMLALAGCGKSDDWRLGFESLGPVRAGMTVEQVRKVVDMPEPPPQAPGEECDYLVHREAGRDFALMIIGGVVVRIELIGASTLGTVAGAHLGSTEAELRGLYGKDLVVQPHKYDPDGHTLTLRSPEGTHGLRFETSQGKVTAIQAGPWEHLHYVEGCS